MRPEHRPRIATPSILALISLALLAAVGCSAKGVEGACAAGAICGGSPVGTWDLAGRCQYPAVHPDQPLGPQEQEKNPLFPSLTPSQAQQTTDGDWCSELYYSPQDNRAPDPNSKIKAVNLWHDAPAVVGGQITFNADSNGNPTSYNTALNFAGQDITHFAPLCLEFYGAQPTCSDLALNLTDFYAQAAGVDASNNPLPPSFQNIVCQGASDGGCDCGYDYDVALTDSGSWSFAGSILTETSDPNSYLYNGQQVGSQAPTGLMVASTCQSGDTLTLTGYNGGNLSDAPGLRVLTLSRHM
jgi:hypothetical protein